MTAAIIPPEWLPIYVLVLIAGGFAIGRMSRRR
jgi:hypothetical protein